LKYFNIFNHSIQSVL